jgi:hypothetical protein
MRNLAIVILAVLTIIFGIYGYTQSVEAQRQFELAMQSERRALVAEDDALRMRDRAEKERQEAIKIRENSHRLEAELNDCRKKKSSK